MVGYNSKLKVVEGGVYKSTRCGEFLVLDRSDHKKVKVKFLATGFETFTQLSHIKAGSINDPTLPIIHGRGYHGIGEYNSRTGKIYLAWKNMFERCYSETYHKRFPTYIGCEVAEEWYNFQNFAKWYKETHPWEVKLPKGRWELDKDLKVPNNKVYSPENCTWLPSNLNANIHLSDPSKDWKYMVGVSYDKSRPNSFKTTFKSMSKPEGKFSKSFKTEIDAHKHYIKMKNKYIQEMVEFYREYLPDETVKLLEDFNLVCPCCENY